MWDTPYFRELYELLWSPPEEWYQDILWSWLPQALDALAAVQPYRKRNTAANPYPAGNDPTLRNNADLLQWYALSRVNDRLLTRVDSTHRNPDLRVRRHHTARYQEYQEYFEKLGFEAYSERPFHPFYHEIVKVEENTDIPDGEIEIGYVYWPGLLFGDMMFSRSGVEVLCAPGALNKEVAETSTLYFTYLREGRPTEDLSLGWGHNSQWGTDFRRDYVEEGKYSFNVDGKYRLDEGYADSLPPYQRSNLDDLTLSERIELLTHRCFVHCTKDSRNRWPWNDMYSMPSSTE